MQVLIFAAFQIDYHPKFGNGNFPSIRLTMFFTAIALLLKKIVFIPFQWNNGFDILLTVGLSLVSLGIYGLLTISFFEISLKTFWFQ
jgi:hypothetical protein